MPTQADLQAYATQAAQANNVPVGMFLWQIGQESSWNPSAKNGNATGIAQFMPGTAANFGIDATNPYQSLDAAAKYDAQLYQSQGSWQGALTSYGTLANASPKTMAAFTNAMNQNVTGTPVTLAEQMAQAKAYYDQNGYAYTPPAAAGSTAEKFQTKMAAAGSSISQYIGQGTFIALGVVVIALAILSNQQTREVIMSTAKGA